MFSFCTPFPILDLIVEKAKEKLPVVGVFFNRRFLHDLSACGFCFLLAPQVVIIEDIIFTGYVTENLTVFPERTTIVVHHRFREGDIINDFVSVQDDLCDDVVITGVGRDVFCAITSDGVNFFLIVTIKAKACLSFHLHGKGCYLTTGSKKELFSYLEKG